MKESDEVGIMEVGAADVARPGLSAGREFEAPAAKGWSLLYKLAKDDVAALDVVVMGRDEALISHRIHGDGWTRLDYGPFVVAVRLER